jgi:hypothetical protein
MSYSFTQSKRHWDLLPGCVAIYTELFGSTLRLGTAGPDTDGEELAVDKPSAKVDAASCLVTRRTDDPSGCGYSSMICLAGKVTSLTSIPRRTGISGGDARDPRGLVGTCNDHG